MVIIRATPLPLGVKNYGMALVDSVKLRHFTTASLLVNVPFSIMWAFIGSQASELSEAFVLAKDAGSYVQDIASRLPAFVWITILALLCVAAVWGGRGTRRRIAEKRS